MVTVVSTKCLSLVEQKRIQWAKEREEMAGLCAPWGPPSSRKEDNYRTCIRTRFVSSTTDLTHQEENTSRSLYNCSEVSSNELEAAVAAKLRRKRSPSLPPIYNRSNCQDQSTQPYDQEEDGEGETSGYASDSNEKNIEYWNQQRQIAYNQQQDSWTSEPGYDRVPRRFVNKQAAWYNSSRGGYRTPDSVVSTPPCRLWSSGGSDEVNRMRWGDRGVGVGHLWEPSFQEPDARLPQVQGSGRGTPSWLERGLNKMNNCDASMASSTTQVLVINHGTPEPSNSNLSRELTGSCDTLSTQSQGECNRTFIRGQNAPVEPEILMERERKRQKAMEHQNAIRQQLEERERKRKEEKERRIREEKAEEERIKREQEIERKRMEEEQRKQREKEEKEARKAAAMREALENAEKKAREEKIRARSKHISESSSKQYDTYTKIETNECESLCDNSSVIEVPLQSVRHCKDPQSISEDKVFQSSDATQTPVKTLNETLLIATETVTMPADGLAVVLGNASDGSSHEVLPASGGSVQLALLMSPGIQPPLMVENRLLTPSKYRMYAKERGTQTDSELVRGRRLKENTVEQHIRKNRKKSASLERPHPGCKLPLRCRSQSQPTQPRMRLEDRPKWGVNRPGTQYIKQSEKDPYYQRRLRQRLMKTALMGMGGDTGTESDTGSHRRRKVNRGSSDDNSRSPSPSQKSYSQTNKKSNKNKHQNRISNMQDRMNITLTKQLNNHEESENRKNLERKETMSSPALSPHLEEHEQLNNRISGTRVMHHSPRGTKRLLKRQSEPPVTLETANEQWSTAQDILSQLSSLRQGLLLKQQEWDSSGTHTPYSESW